MPRLGLIVAILVAVVDILYIAIIHGQPASDLPWRVPFVAAYLAAIAVCAALSTRVRSRRWQAGLLATSAAGLLLLGFFGLFSIGLPLVVAGLLAIAGLASVIGGSARRGVMVASSLAGGLVAVVVLLAGFEVTERIITCPPGVVSGGGGSGFLTGSYSYTCQGGRAIVTYGR